MESEPQGPVAPSVVAVVVTRDPGSWLDEVLAGLAAQDYPNLSTLVIDAASARDSTGRIAAVLPSAYVRRLGHNPGFGAAANEVLEVVEGAAFYAFCHDDVALAPDAIRLMVEEAFRSNAGVVGPKLVRWDDPRRLLQVGLAADKTGVPAPYVERGELDQEQHDAVRDVFAVPGACTLIRADLFNALGGYDPAITFHGDDLDLCWRAHVAGARVLVAPEARVRHLEALGARRPVDDRRRLQARHRLRTLLTTYRPFHLVRVLPQAALLALVEVLYSVVVGRTRQARDVAGAWTWNFRRLGAIRANRRVLGRARRVRDSEVRRLQVRGSARVTAFLRGQIGRGEDRLASVSSAGRELVGALRTGPNRTTVLVWAGLLLVLAVGSRHLLTRPLPAVGALAEFPDSPWTLFGQWVSGWRSAGLGSEAPAPTGFALLGVAGTVAVGAMGVLRKVLVLGMLPLGLLGAWRLARPLASRRARLVAVIVYAAVPVPYNALASGRWRGLVVYAAAPFLVAALARATGLAPFADPGEGAARPAGRGRALVRGALGLGLLTAVVGALVPSVAVLVLVVAVGVAAGSVLTAEVGGTGRLLATAAGAVLVAAVLHVPWTLDFLLPGSEWSAFGGVTSGPDSTLDLGQLLRFETGPVGAAPLGWAFLVAAALPLLIGRDWRLAWATRGWTVALACWGVLWADHRDWLPVGLPAPEVVLAPAAAGLALAAALGVVAFELDLPGYRFGLRQVASGAAALAVVAGVVPAVGAALGGRWDVPQRDFNRVLSFLEEEERADGPFRVLWIGAPDVVPLAGWELDEGLAYATTDGGTPRVEDLWAGSSDGATQLIADALELAGGAETSRLGRLLAPMGIRYVVLPEQLAPVPYTGRQYPLPEDLSATLAEQLDLEQVDLNPALVVYRNAAWAPVRAMLPEDVEVEQTRGGLTAAITADLSGASPVLPDEDGYVHYRGSLNGGGDVYLAAASSDGWQLRVDGDRVPRGKAFGWANAFAAVDRSGPAELRYRTSVLRYAILAVQVVLWLAVIRGLLLLRRRPRGTGA